MSSLQGAVDMNNLGMPAGTSLRERALATDPMPPTGDNMLLEASIKRSPEFTDPTALQSLRELETDVKFGPPGPGSLSISMGISQTPILHAAQSSTTSVLGVPSGSSLIMPAKQHDLSTMVSPPPSTFSSNETSPNISSHPPFIGAMTQTGSPGERLRPENGLIGSPVLPGVTSATGVALSGIIPTRNGTQVTVGEMVASVLDSVVQMASQARDAYLAGKQDQTHAEIEELLESLKLVGGLGIGPQITGVRSNRLNIDQDVEVAGPSSLVGLNETSPAAGATRLHDLPETHYGASLAVADAAWPYSTAVVNEISQSISPLVTTIPVTPPAVGGVHGASASVNSTPSPPTSLRSKAFPAPLTTAREGDSGTLPMGQVPSQAIFDAARKRTCDSAPTKDVVFRGPAKVSKLSPSGNEPDPVPEPVVPSGAGSATLSGRISPAKDHAVMAPLLIHARTFPLPGGTSLPLAAKRSSSSLEPTATLASLAVQSQGFMTGVIAEGDLQASTGVAPAQFPAGENVIGSPQGPLPTGFQSQATPVVTTIQQPAWLPEASGTVILPPHSSPPDRRVGSDESGFRPGALVPTLGACMVELPLYDHPMLDTNAPVSFVSPTTASHSIPLGTSNDTMNGLSMDVDLRTPPHTASSTDLSSTLEPASPLQKDFHSHATQMPFDPYAPVQPGLKSRPTATTSRTSPPQSSAAQPMAFKSERSDSVPEESDDDADDDDGDSEDDEDDSLSHGAHHPDHSKPTSKRSPSKPPSKKRARDKTGGFRPDLNLSVDVKAEVDRIFFEYLNNVCSNLDATDAKGELIHQVLMAKKMARMDESPDFRPFKFRIQAFTNGFVEELSRQGYDENRIPMKKIKTYLWYHTPYIARFNDDGKKAKSKGNHIWHTEAKKCPGTYSEGQTRWVFHQYSRKIAGTPPTMAYIGLKWSWEPKIWDPQMARSSIVVNWNFPNMAPWMKFENGVLSGVPLPDSPSTDLVAESRSKLDGREVFLTRTFPLTVAPLAVGDSFATARRSSLLLSDTKRFAGEVVSPQTLAPRLPHLPSPTLSTQLPTAAESAQVMAVLTTAANRVAQEAQSIQAPPGPALVHTQAVLAKQQQVLTVTAKVIENEANNALAGRSVGEIPVAGSVLAQAAQAVVHQAARQVQADKTAVAMQQSKQTAHPTTIPPPVSLTDVSIATQSAVAHAIAITGNKSSEVDIMLTANSLIQQRSRAESRSGGRPPMPAQSPPQATFPPLTNPQTANDGPGVPATFPHLAPQTTHPR